MKALDYVIAEMKGGKPFLAQVKSIDDKVISVIPDHLRYKELRTLDITKRDVLVRLGPKPKPGKVYGVDVSNVYRKSINHDSWGPIHFFVKLDETKLKMLRLGLDFTAKKLEKAGLFDYSDRFQTEIRAKKGKYAGMYVHAREGNSLVWYAPEIAADQDVMNYIIFHEYGHVLRFNGLTRPKARAKWQRLFQQSIAPVVVSKKSLDSLLSHLKNEIEGTESSLSSIIKDFAGEDESIAVGVKALGRWLRQIHHVSPKDLEVLWSASDFDTIEQLWPKSSIDTSKLAPVISEYATKNVEETFAEAFAFHMQGKKLPAHVTKLLDKTLSIIKEAA
jgi:hypothetical protein